MASGEPKRTGVSCGAGPSDGAVLAAARTGPAATARPVATGGDPGSGAETRLASAAAVPGPAGGALVVAARAGPGPAPALALISVTRPTRAKALLIARRNGCITCLRLLIAVDGGWVAALGAPGRPT